MRAAELIMAVVLGLISIYIMWLSGKPEWEGDPWHANIWYSDEGIGSGFWPFWLSGLMLLCCVWISVNWWRRLSPPSQSSAPYLDSYGIMMLIKVGGGVFGFVLLVEYIGMYAGMFVFLLYYLLLIGRHRVGTSLAIATGLPIVTFFFFDVAMRIVLPKGMTEPLFIPLYDIFL